MSEWHRKPVCKTCAYLRIVGGYSEKWDGKACHYMLDTNKKRVVPATDDFCMYYKERKKTIEEKEEEE